MTRALHSLIQDCLTKLATALEAQGDVHVRQMREFRRFSRLAQWIENHIEDMGVTLLEVETPPEDKGRPSKVRVTFEVGKDSQDCACNLLSVK